MAYLFPQLRTAYNMVRQISEKSRFGRPFDTEQGKRSQTLFESAQQQLYHIYWSVWKILCCKKSLLVICKILGLFVNRLTADDKYFLLNRGNLTQPIQLHLSKKKELGEGWFFLHF